MVHYIDDWVFFCQPVEHAALSQRILKDITDAGFLLNKEKCHGLEKPTFKFSWIGYEIDLSAGNFGVLEHHVAHVEEQCAALVALPVGARVPALQLMQLLGKLASASRVLGSTLRLWTFF